MIDKLWDHSAVVTSLDAIKNWRKMIRRSNQGLQSSDIKGWIPSCLTTPAARSELRKSVGSVQHGRGCWCHKDRINLSIYLSISLVYSVYLYMFAYCFTFYPISVFLSLLSLSILLPYHSTNWKINRYNLFFYVCLFAYMFGWRNHNKITTCIRFISLIKAYKLHILILKIWLIKKQKHITETPFR